jgi:hypothetical protein
MSGENCFVVDRTLRAGGTRVRERQHGQSKQAKSTTYRLRSEGVHLGKA